MVNLVIVQASYWTVLKESCTCYNSGNSQTQPNCTY